MPVQNDIKLCSAVIISHSFSKINRFAKFCTNIENKKQHRQGALPCRRCSLIAACQILGIILQAVKRIDPIRPFQNGGLHIIGQTVEIILGHRIAFEQLVYVFIFHVHHLISNPADRRPADRFPDCRAPDRCPAQDRYPPGSALLPPTGGTFFVCPSDHLRE